MGSVNKPESGCKPTSITRPASLENVHSMNVPGEELPAVDDHSHVNEAVDDMRNQAPSPPGALDRFHVCIDELGDLIIQACESSGYEVSELEAIRQQALEWIKELTPSQIYLLMISEEERYRDLQGEVTTYRKQLDDELERRRLADREHAERIEEINNGHHAHQFGQDRRIDSLRRLNTGLEIRLTHELSNTRLLTDAVNELVAMNNENQRDLAIYRNVMMNLPAPVDLRPWMNSLSNQLHALSRSLGANEEEPNHVDPDNHEPRAL